MQIGIDTSAPSRVKHDAVLIFGTKEGGLAKTVRSFGKGHAEAWRTLHKSKAFTGEAGQRRASHEGPDARVKSVIFVGVGDASDGNVLRDAAADAIRDADGLGASTVGVVLPAGLKGKKLPTPMIGAIAEGLALGLYRFNGYKSNAKAPKIDSVDVITPDDESRRVSKALREADALVAGVVLARDLGNEPSNIATPSYLAEVATELAESEDTLTIEVLDEDEMRSFGMGSLLGVAKGSAEPPKLIILRYEPKRKSKGRRDTVAIVGKGITFDTGGISIKPGAKMEDMKFDMCGGAAVIGAMKAVAGLGVPTRVVGVVPAVENMPDGASYKPGDILKAMNGTTIEVQNTDAEGRLILADALTYAATKLKPKPKAVIDLATLTGACVVALGSHNAALIGNDEDLVERLLDASERSGDALWRLPISDGYRKQLDSAYADVANLGGRGGGTITAGAFLEKFTEGVPWSHLDIAGMAWTEKNGGQFTKGATGFGVRVLARLLQRW